MSEVDFPPFTAMLRDALAGQVHDASTFLSMVSDDVLLEYPYTSDGPQRLQGRPAMREHLTGVSAMFVIDTAEVRNLFRCGAETTIIEFGLSGRWLVNDAGFDISDVAIIETRDGHIVRYREYWNPLHAIPPAE